jgi:hypothetical protein
MDVEDKAKPVVVEDFSIIRNENNIDNSKEKRNCIGHRITFLSYTSAKMVDGF